MDTTIINYVRTLNICDVNIIQSSPVSLQFFLKKLIWQNSVASFLWYCKSKRKIFTKESNKIIREESLKHSLILTMEDEKVYNAATWMKFIFMS